MNSDQKSSTMDVVVIGSNMIDLLSHIQRLPKLGETVVGDSFHLGFGGKGANQAVMAAKLGAKVGMITKVGDDVFGVMTRENFDEKGIATDYIYTEEGMSSGVAPIFVDKDGNNLIVIIPGANLALKPSEVEKAGKMIGKAKVVLSQLEINDDAIIAGFRIAREVGAMTLINPAPAREISPELLNLSDMLIPNETEAALLTGIEVSGIEGAEEAGKKLINQGARKVLITLGKDGALLCEQGCHAFFPAVNVQAVDTTGAGDAFIGSLVYDLARGAELTEAIRFAGVAAALSVTKIGTQTSFPTLGEIQSLQKKMSDNKRGIR